jgi:hypothetical protein
MIHLVHNVKVDILEIHLIFVLFYVQMDYLMIQVILMILNALFVIIIV